MRTININRDSGIELLKIITVFIIVLSHVYNTFHHNFNYINNFLDNFGTIGDTLFFICSAWYLGFSLKNNYFKIFKMIFEVWIISITILAISEIILRGGVSPELFIRSLFPTLLKSNWYVLCYTLFYPLHVILNKIINEMPRYKLLAITTIIFFIFIVMNYLTDKYFYSELTVWVAIYFFISYIRKYIYPSLGKTNFNIFGAVLTLIGIIGLTIEIILFKKFSLESPAPKYCNPFIILFCTGIFCLFKTLTFKNALINTISSLSLFTYVIHENVILRTVFRPAIVIDFCSLIDTNNFIYEIILFSILLFVLTSLISYFMKYIFNKTENIEKKLYRSCSIKIRNVFIIAAAKSNN